MIALLIAAIILAAVYDVFMSDFRAFISHNLILEAHESEKMALEFMKREIELIGYDAESQPVSGEIIKAKRDYFAFEEYNRQDNLRARIVYEFDPAKAVVTREISFQDISAPPTSPAWLAPQSKDIFIENVRSFTFAYYSGDNDELSFNASGEISSADVMDIRRVDISLEVKTQKKDPIRNLFLSREITTSVFIRNLGLSTIFDTTPPEPPVNVVVSDPHVCGMLTVNWTRNTEGDLSGYIIYVGLEDRETSPYTQKFVVGSPDAEAFTLTGLDSAPSTSPGSVKYYVAMTAFDQSMNMSDFSVEVHGDGSGESDTISNPDKPSPPDGLTGTDGPSEGSVKLSWAPSADLDVVGYRVYRSTTPFVTFPIDASYDPGNVDGTVLVADEATTPVTLSRTSQEFTDTGLIGCRVYYYAVCAVNCDLTLISNDPGDTDDTRYVRSDYSLAAGDGSGPGDDFPAGADTAPLDITPIDDAPYPVPDISSKAGWKRVFLSLTNPNKGDDPDFDRTMIYFSKTAFPILNPDGTVSGGSLVPDHGGVFEAEGTVPPVVFDSNSLENPPEPELEIFQTYYFLAISYDLCGNPTNATEEARTLSELCGDDPDYAGAPPVPNGLSAEGCSTSARLSWNHQGDVIVDLAGYHVYRNAGGTFNLSASTELTGGAPQWFSYFTDANVVEGGTYSYGVRASDCYYENIDPSDPNYTTAKTNNISDPAKIEGIKPGRVKLDDLLVRPRTGDITISAPTYYHNSVTFFVENTSAGSLSLSDMKIGWDNSLAFLSQVYVGSTDPTAGTHKELVFTGRAPSGTTIPVNKSLLDYGTIGSGSRAIPIELVFTTADGDVSRLVNMREEVMTVSITYENESMPMTIDCMFDRSLVVPLGPTVVGTTQNRPSIATPAWPVPGSDGANPSGSLVVPGGVSVSVSAHVYDNSNIGIKEVTLYYFVDTLSLYDETSGPPAFDGSNYTPIQMILVAGSLYRTISNIPPSDDSTIWYFIVAEDNDGNFDRDPEIYMGAYNYYQQEGDVCNNTPAAPGNLTGTTGADSVTLSWDAPTKNVDGSDIGLDLQGYNVYRDNGLGWVKLNAETVISTTYVDAGITDLATKDYSYKVTALDYCEPEPNVGPASAVFSECEGAPNCLITVDRSELFPGDSFKVDLTVCDLSNGTPAEVLYIQTCSGAGDTDPIKMKEEGDTGVFHIDSAFYGRDYIKTYRAADYPGSAIDLDLMVDSSDTITVGGISGPAAMPPTPAFSDSLCEHLSDGTLVTFDCEVTLVVKPYPCDTTPRTPTNLAIIGSNNGAKTIDLAWGAPTANTDGTALTDLQGYRIYRSDNEAPYTLIATIGAVTTYTDGVPGQPNKNTYRYYVTAVDTCSPTANESSRSNYAICDHGTLSTAP
jgi:hypothetical protein